MTTDLSRISGCPELLPTRRPSKSGILGTRAWSIEDALLTEWNSFGLDAMEDKAHLPSLVILLNPSECLGAIKECTTMRIPTIGIVDTDTDPRIVTYPIPANMEVSLLYNCSYLARLFALT